VPPGAAELLDEWPVPEPPDWLARVNTADTAGELEASRRCVRRGRPYGDEEWVTRTAESLRPASRPTKKAASRLIGFQPFFLAACENPLSAEHKSAIDNPNG
jgi:hypothetical protein